MESKTKLTIIVMFISHHSASFCAYTNINLSLLHSCLAQLALKVAPKSPSLSLADTCISRANNYQGPRSHTITLFDRVTLYQPIVAWQHLTACSALAPLSPEKLPTTTNLYSYVFLNDHYYKSNNWFINLLITANQDFIAALKLHTQKMAQQTVDLETPLGGEGASCGYHVLKNALRYAQARQEGTIDQLPVQLMDLLFIDALFATPEQHDFVAGITAPGVWRNFILQQLKQQENASGTTVTSANKLSEDNGDWLNDTGLELLWNHIGVNSNLLDSACRETQEKLYAAKKNIEFILFSTGYENENAVKKFFDSYHTQPTFMGAVAIRPASEPHWLLLMIDKGDDRATFCIMDSKNKPRFQLKEIITCIALCFEVSPDIIEKLINNAIPAMTTDELAAQKHQNEAEAALSIQIASSSSGPCGAAE